MVVMVIIITILECTVCVATVLGPTCRAMMKTETTTKKNPLNYEVVVSKNRRVPKEVDLFLCGLFCIFACSLLDSFSMPTKEQPVIDGDDSFVSWTMTCSDRGRRKGKRQSQFIPNARTRATIVFVP